MVGTVLDSGVGISNVSVATVGTLQKRCLGVNMVRPYDRRHHQVVFADGRAVPIERQTCTLTAAITTPWSPVAIRLAPTVMPEENDSLTLGSKTLREKLTMDVIKKA